MMASSLVDARGGRQSLTRPCEVGAMSQEEIKCASIRRWESVTVPQRSCMLLTACCCLGVHRNSGDLKPRCMN